MEHIFWLQPTNYIAWKATDSQENSLIILVAMAILHCTFFSDTLYMAFINYCILNFLSNYFDFSYQVLPMNP